ncbi:methyltransferase [Clostridia bacterium]|nr:methyltransferase [Clostridia bacterium]
MVEGRIGVLNQCITDNYALYHGDSCEVLQGIPDNSIHYIIFSPPFASLYTYSNSERDLGNCRNDQEFIEQFRYIVEQLYRITIPGRILSFHCMNLPTSKERDGYIGIRDFRGDLIRLFESIGWIYHSEVVIWKDPVTAMQRTKALGLLHKQLKKDSCMSRQGIPDYLVSMRKPGVNPEPVHHTNESFPVSVWQRYASPIWTDINPSDTLQYRSAREENDERHIAPLQLSVIRRGLELWSNPGDSVLTPFGGIGSEAVVALEMGRRAIGIELKESYYKQMVSNCLTAVQSQKTQTIFDLLDE